MYFTQQAFALPGAEGVPIEVDLQERQAGNGTDGVLVTFSRQAEDETEFDFVAEFEAQENELDSVDGFEAQENELDSVDRFAAQKNELDSVDGFAAQKNELDSVDEFEAQKNKESMQGTESDQIERRRVCRTRCYRYVCGSRICYRCFVTCITVK